MHLITEQTIIIQLTALTYLWVTGYFAEDSLVEELFRRKILGNEV